MSKLPPEVLRFIETAEVSWSDHAADSADRLGLWREDILALARSGQGHESREDDYKQALDGLKHSVTGRDTRGRRLYMAGKMMYVEAEKRWNVVTVHEPNW